MALSGLLGSSLTTSTNVAPSSLSTVSPYPSTYVDARTVSSAWTSQGVKALFPAGTKNTNGMAPLKVHFKPSNGSAVTYTITLWMFNKISGSWGKVKNNGSISYTGEQIDQIENPGTDPLYFQIESISAGSLSIYFDNGIAQAY